MALSTEEAAKAQFSLGDVVGAAIDFVEAVASADPNELARIFEFARRATGTEVERTAMQMVVAMRAAAVEQVRLADAAISVIEACSALLDQSALTAAEPATAGPQQLQ